MHTLTDEERESLFALVRWKPWITTAQVFILLLLALIIVVGMRALEHASDAQKELGNLRRDFRAQKEKVDPFIAEPRFTFKHYQESIRADLLEFEKGLPPETTKRRLENMEQAYQLNRDSISSLDTRVFRFENVQKIHEKRLDAIDGK